MYSARNMVTAIIVIVLVLLCSGGGLALWAQNKLAEELGLGAQGQAPPVYQPDTAMVDTQTQMLVRRNQDLQAELDKANVTISALEGNVAELDDKTDQLLILLQVAQQEAEKARAEGTADAQREIAAGTRAILEANANEIRKESAGELWDEINPTTFIVILVVVFFGGVGLTIGVLALLVFLGVGLNRLDDIKKLREAEKASTAAQSS